MANKKTKKYVFNPTDFGYISSKNFPELKDHLARISFVKVIATLKRGNEEKLVYWFSSCSKVCQLNNWDERWEFYSNSWSPDKGVNCGHQVYLGSITSKKYAIQLLSHILGPLDNTVKMGLERVKAKSLPVK